MVGVLNCLGVVKLPESHAQSNLRMLSNTTWGNGIQLTTNIGLATLIKRTDVQDLIISPKELRVHQVGSRGRILHDLHRSAEVEGKTLIDELNGEKVAIISLVHVAELLKMYCKEDKDESLSHQHVNLALVKDNQQKVWQVRFHLLVEEPDNWCLFANEYQPSTLLNVGTRIFSN